MTTDIRSLYDIAVVTGSADCPDTFGYCDLAIGWFRPSRRRADDVRRCVTSRWRELRATGQERWAYLFDTGAIDEETADVWAGEVWPANDEDDEDDDVPDDETGDEQER